MRSPTLPPPSFSEWYPFYLDHMIAATNQCQTELSRYYHANGPQPLPNDTNTPCAMVINCFLDHLSEGDKANMACSIIILGLIPTILTLIGSDMSEIVPILLERPLFASLISFGLPVTSVVRLFSSYEAKAEPPRPLTATLRQRFAPSGKRHGRPSDRIWAAILSVVQYFSLAAAIFNQISNTLDLGRRVVIAWHCTFSVAGQILLWVFLGFLGQWIAASSLILQKHNVHSSRAPSAPSPPHEARPQRPATTARRSNKTVQARAQQAIHWLFHKAKAEFTPRVFRSDSESAHHKQQPTQPSILSDLLYLLASMVGLGQFVYGTLIFSSFLFISTPDAAAVAARYIITGVVCRTVLFFELDAMKDMPESTREVDELKREREREGGWDRKAVHQASWDTVAEQNDVVWISVLDTKSDR